MYPPTVGITTESLAERKLFGKIQRELSNKWCVLHSLGLATHDKKPWAEIDFVMIGPVGLFCLEVKGGGVARSDGIWTTTNDRGIHRLHESPFQQAASASTALFRFLAAHVPHARTVATGFGVATPDIRFNIIGPDIISEVVFDLEDTSRSFEVYIERLGRYWTTAVTELTGKRPQPLDQNLVHSLVTVLRADFDLRPTLRVQVGAAKEELTRWTQRQSLIFAGLTENPRVVIRGGAGTGKTFLAVEEAKRLASKGQRVLLTCFNRRLADYLAPAATATPNLTIRHLHGLMADIVSKAGTAGMLPDAQPSDLFDVFYPEFCIDALLSGTMGSFDAIVVDEGQDLLLGSYLDVLDCALEKGLTKGTWRVFLDPNQDIYSAMRSKGITQLSTAVPVQFVLTENCRNTGPIATNTSLLSGIPLEPVLCEDGPAVTREWYNGREQQRRAVSKVLREWLHQGIRAEDIVVLSPFRLENSCVADGLLNVAAGFGETPRNAIPGTIGFYTLSSFKGLESPAVALIDIDDLESNDGAFSIYVGATRAQALLAIFMNISQQVPASKRAEAFGKSIVSARG